jgi:poly(A) polymerase
MKQGFGFKLNKGGLKNLSSVEALYIINLLSKGVNRARFVGGCVRDILLFKEVKDIDIATPYTPEEVVKILDQNGIKVILTGLSFGTVTVIYNTKKFEITSLREDIETDGRYARVKYTTDWKKDAERRDFTFNSLSYDPIEDRVYDYNTGVEDLSQGIVRFIGDPLARIKEDHLRILRYFRFYAYYSQRECDQEVLNIITNNRGLLAKLSGERIQEEMLKILAAETACQVVKTMDQAGIMSQILGDDIFALSNKLKNLPYAKDRSHALRNLYFLLRDEGAIIGLAKRWNLSNTMKDLLKIYFKGEKENHDFSLHNMKYLLFLFHREIVIDLLYLHAAKTTMDREVFVDKLQILSTLIKPIFPISGKDIIEHGIATIGIDIKKSLENAKKIWISSDFAKSKEDILREIK